MRGEIINGRILKMKNKTIDCIYGDNGRWCEILSTKDCEGCPFRTPAQNEDHENLIRARQELEIKLYEIKEKLRDYE